jgi:hypothetical protein
MRAFLLALVLALGVAATAWAAIPDGDGAISSCYAKKGGKLRVVKEGKKCKKTERPLTWSQTGPAGRAGAPGAKGAAGAKGAKGDPGGPGAVYTTFGFEPLTGIDPVTLGELDLPAGRYLVVASGGSVNSETDAAEVWCDLVSDTDSYGSVSQTVPAGQSMNLSGHVAIELPSAQSVRLECTDFAETDGVESTVVLSAMPVGSIVQQ